MNTRTTLDADLEAVLGVHRAAFAPSEVEAGLVAACLDDPTARPLISLLAEDDEGRPVGHVLLTHADVEPSPDDARYGRRPYAQALLLAPLAVVPEAQGRGVGATLVEEALEVAGEAGVGLVFVLGHPGYYRRFGFAGAAGRGLDPLYPLDAESAAAWQVRELHDGALQEARGRVRCAQTWMREGLWR